MSHLSKEILEALARVSAGVAYNPILDRDYIRYMILEPGKDEEPLVCSLHISSLNEIRPYEALSYVWGSDQRDHEIISDGRIINITANLSSALRRVRLPTEPRTLWADSICINQADIVERGKQVLLMGRIYGQASRVLMYIGPNSDGHSEAAASLLSELDVMITNGIKDAGHSWNAFPFPNPEERDRLLADKRWESFLTMTQQPWFHRGWVIQEAGLSANGLMLWGNTELSWQKVIRAFTWMVRRFPQIRTKYRDGMNRLHIERYRMGNQTETMSLYQAPASFDFLIILHDARALSLKDPRDRVYAFLSLANAAKVDIRLQPNYSATKTAPEVYLDLAREWIDSTGNISILHCVQHTEMTIETHFPSWVPRWDLNLFENIIVHTAGPSLIPSKSRPTLSAANTLKVSGVIFDRVVFSSNPMSREISIGEMSFIWDTMSQIDPESCYASPHRAIAFAYILSAGGSWGAIWTEWIRWRDAYIRRLQRDGRPTAQDEQGIKLFHTYAQWNVHNRQVIVTKRGYYGLAPPLVCENDVCCLIIGGKAPCILRETNRPGQYRLIGDACIPGKSLHEHPNGGEVLSSVGAEGHRDWLEWGAEEQDLFLC